METEPQNPPRVNPETQPRGRPSDEGRFLWISSLAAERIVNELGQTQGAFGIAVYVALVRLSSKEKNDPCVRASVSKIAGMARLGYRRTLESLHQLRDLAKVITIDGQREPGRKTQDESVYTLLATRLPGSKSGRLPNGKPGRLPVRKSSYAENPKETPLKGELERETVPAIVGSALGEQPTGNTVSRKMRWDAEGEP